MECYSVLLDRAGEGSRASPAPQWGKDDERFLEVKMTY